MPYGLLILGRVAGLDGFVMAAGHEGDVTALAPITGEIIADLIANNRTDLTLEAYRLEQFDPIQAEELEYGVCGLLSVVRCREKSFKILKGGTVK